MKLTLASAILAGGIAMSGAAFAQGASTAAPAAAPSTTTIKSPMKPAMQGSMKGSMPKADRTARSKECSMEADQKGLHGKARKSFRNKCKSQG